MGICLFKQLPAMLFTIAIALSSFVLLAFQENDKIKEIKSLIADLSSESQVTREKAAGKILSLVKEEAKNGKAVSSLVSEIKQVIKDTSDAEVKEKLVSIIECFAGRYMPMMDCPFQKKRTFITAFSSEKIVVLSGSDKKSYEDAAIYDIAKNNWTKIAACPVTPKLISESGMIQDKMFIVGDRVVYFDGKEGAVYDVKSDKWSKLKPAPVKERISFSININNNKLIMWGGCQFTKERKYLNDGAFYDVEKETWIEIGSAPVEGRDRHTALIDGDKLFIWGGSNTMGDDEKPFSDGAVFDFKKASWSKFKDSPIKGRTSHGMVIYSNKIFIWGGQRTYDSIYNDGAIYDVANDKWEKMSESPLKGKYFHRMLVWKDKLVIWGGLDKNGNCYNEGAIYDSTTDKWTSIDNCPVGGRHGQSLIQINDKIVMWGGVDIQKFYNNGAIYDLAKSKWMQIKESTLDGRGFHMMVPMADKVVIWGGKGTGDKIFKNDGVVFELPIVWED